MSESFDFRHTGRFTVGTLGEPGRRVFYFQTFGDGTEVALKCEKQQAVALADHLVGLLDELPGTIDPGPHPPAEALPPADLAWTVGAISLGVDREAGRIVVELEELVLPDDPDEDPDELPDGARLRVRLTADQVHGYAAQVAHLVAESRPLCRLCERPIDPTGHACPRLN